MNAKRNVLDAGSRDPRRFDRTPWAYRSPCFRAFDFTFAVRSVYEEVGPYLDHVLSGLLSAQDEPGSWYSIVHSTENPDRPYALLFGSERLTVAHSKAFAIRMLLWHVNSAAVSSTPSTVVLHAGGVALGDAGVIISGPSGSGKTTLTAALVRAGFRYLTDEAISFDPMTSLLYPYPKALAIQPGSWDLLDDLRPSPSELSPTVWHVVPTDIRPDAIAGPSHPALILFPTHQRPDPGEAILREMVRSEALVELFGQSFGGGAAPARTLLALRALVERCRCFRLSTTDLPGAVRSVTEMMQLLSRREAASRDAARSKPGEGHTTTM